MWPMGISQIVAKSEQGKRTPQLWGGLAESESTLHPTRGQEIKGVEDVVGEEGVQHLEQRKETVDQVRVRQKSVRAAIEK